MHRIRALLLPALCIAQALSCGEPAGPTAGSPAVLERIRGHAQTGLPGAALDTALVVQLRDDVGTAVAGAVVTFRVLSGGGSVTPTELRTAGDGTAEAQWVLGGLVQTEQMAVATVSRQGGPPLQVVFTALATATGPVAEVASMVPALLTPGALLTVAGSNLEHVSAASVAGVTAEILEQSSTLLRLQLPSGGFDCAPTTAVPVLFTSAGGQVMRMATMRTAPQRALVVGQALVGSQADPLSCIELPGGEGRYLIAVANTSADTAVKPGLRVRAVSPEPLPQPDRPEEAVPEQRSVEGAEALHTALLRARGLRSARLQAITREAAAEAGLNLDAAAIAVEPVVGDTLSIRVPRLSATTVPQACAVFDEVRARVVVVGQHVVVLEDVTNPLADMMDGLYVQVADEFDARQFDIISENFHDPLRNGTRVLMLFSRLVNSYDVSGFVWAGDFTPRASCAQSNEAEVFYGYVPTLEADGYAAGTRSEWLWTIQPTVIHEVKHLASMVQQLGSGGAPEELWLEEATAMVAEEIWAREVFGYAQHQNVEFSASVGCEIAGAFDREPCIGKPGAMFAHYLLLSTWLEAPDALTLLGPSAMGDFSFYGSAWLFLRWLLDSAARPEDELLRELTAGAATGIGNMENVFGRTFEELLPQWATAVLLDDRPLAPQVPGWFIESWDLRSVYSGLNREQPTLFPTTFPLRVHALSYGNSAAEVSAVRGGGAAFFELSGPPAGPQALGFSGLGGTALPSSFRVVIVRLD
ncbi:MAG: hypothetical protein WD054_05260 [Gemmatimonadota bacterium]